MRALRVLAFLVGWLGLGNVLAWSHGGGAPHDPGEQRADPEAETRARQRQLAKIQEKIDKLEQQLENPKLSAKKRGKLEKKLKRLLHKKDELLS